MSRHLRMGPSVAPVDRQPLDEIADRFAADRHCPTLSWGITIDGALTVGHVGEVTEHTVYRIASMTKSFSAAAVLLLRDEGRLRLDDTVQTHAPELASLDRTDSASITIRDLLSMTSGLPSDDPWADRHLDMTDEEFDQVIADGPLFAHATGAAFEYSNFGFAVLGRVVRRATGHRLQDFVTTRLLEPLGMTRTTWVRPSHDDWARPYERVDDVDVPELDPLGDGMIAPMGGIWSTVADLDIWVRWLDDAFPPRDEPDDGPLARPARREMQSPHRYTGVTTHRGVRCGTSYGFGVRVLDDPDLGIVAYHSGGVPGYGSNMRWLPGRRVGAIALANTTYAPMAELTAALLDQVAAQGLIPETAVPVSVAVSELAQILVTVLSDWDDDRAVGAFTASLIQDVSLDRQRREAERLIAAVGVLTISSIIADTAARATVTCVGSTGATATITMMVAPPRPPRIQSYEVHVGSDDQLDR